MGNNTTSYRIIAICGNMQTGKDTLATMITKHCHNGMVCIINYSDAIAASCSREFGIPIDTFRDVGIKNVAIPTLNNRTPRDLMRIVGDAGRSVDPDYWNIKVKEKIDHWIVAARKHNTGNPKITFVIPGLRMRAEAAYVQTVLKGSIIGIRRPATHDVDINVPSEVEVASVLEDFAITVIDNDQGLASLDEKAAAMIDTVPFNKFLHV